MIPIRAIIYKYSRKTDELKADKFKQNQSLGGDSDVGQASEFPPRFLSPETSDLSQISSEIYDQKESADFFERQLFKIKSRPFLLTSKWFSKIGSALLLFGIL